MANRANHAAKRKWHNWLASFDQWARRLPKFKRWQQADSYFLYARHPRLQPTTRKKEPRTKHERFLQASHDAFEETIADWQQRIMSREKTRRVVRDLSEKQVRQLAALTVDIYAGLDEYVRLKPIDEHFRELASEITKCERVRQRKLKKAREALEALIWYEKRLPREIRTVSVSSSGTMVGKTLSSVAESALSLLPEEIPRTPDFAAALRHPDLPSFPKYPVSFCLVRLFWFFRHECQLGTAESCVRAGLLFNSIAPAGVPPVLVRDSYQDAESARCQAVYQAAKRFRLTTQ